MAGEPTPPLPSGKDRPQPSLTRLVVAASFGNALEWYDFSVYAFFASYIAHNFFTTDDPTSALIDTFVVFGAGFLARPLGAVLVGAYGDRVGRKAALMMSIATMGLGTLVIAAAPSVVAIGIGAPILLLVGRLLQGFSAGGELGSAAAFLVEHAPPDRRGRYAAWLQASMGLANLGAAVMGVTITTLFTEDDVENWAWRIPFLVGLCIIPVGIYIRRVLPETEVFEHSRTTQPRRPLRELLVGHHRQLLTCCLFSILWTVSVYTYVIYLPTYYRNAELGLDFTSRQAFLASLVGNIALVVGCIVVGRLADRFHPRRMIRTATLALAAVPPFCLLALQLFPTVPVLLAAHTVLCTTVAGFVGIAPSIAPRIFPTSVRTTGLSIGYNTAAVLFAGFTPALMTWAVHVVGGFAPAIWVSLGVLACLPCLPVMFRQIDAVAAAAGEPVAVDKTQQEPVTHA